MTRPVLENQTKYVITSQIWNFHYLRGN